MALTKKDLEQIDKRLEQRLEFQKADILEEIDERLDDKLTKLKSDFFDKIDPILKEVLTSRDKKPLIENRLEALEKIHAEGKHALSS